MMGVFVQFNEPRMKGKWAGHLMGYVIQESGCWQWIGNTDRDGYGRTCDKGRDYMAHRVVYERTKGPIPHGLTLDHLCRNTGCVNPDHLEPVLNKVNVLRGVGHTAQNARKTHCKWGHAFTQENTQRKPEGGRICRTCYQSRLTKKEPR